MSIHSGNVETLRWRNNQLEMIDQRVLPAKLEYFCCNTAARVADGIRSMVIRGAPAIGVAAAYGVALEALRLQNDSKEAFQVGLDSGFDVLSRSRPTAVNLFWALERMRSVWKKMCLHG